MNYKIVYRPRYGNYAIYRRGVRGNWVRIPHPYGTEIVTRRHALNFLEHYKRTRGGFGCTFSSGLTEFFN